MAGALPLIVTTTPACVLLCPAVDTFTATGPFTGYWTVTTGATVVVVVTTGTVTVLAGWIVTTGAGVVVMTTGTMTVLAGWTVTTGAGVVVVTAGTAPILAGWTTVLPAAEAVPIKRRERMRNTVITFMIDR